MPVDHPVAVFGLEQHELPSRPRPVQDELHLGVGPLLCLVGAVIPDGHLSLRRTRPVGSHLRRSRIRGGGPRCAPRGGCCPGTRAVPWAGPTRQGLRLARGAGPNADCAAWCSWITKRFPSASTSGMDGPSAPASCSGPASCDRYPAHRGSVDSVRPSSSARATALAGVSSPRAPARLAPFVVRGPFGVGVTDPHGTERHRLTSRGRGTDPCAD